MNQVGAEGEVGFEEGLEAGEFVVGKPDVGLGGIGGVSAFEGLFVVWSFSGFGNVLFGVGMLRDVFEAWRGVASVVRAA